MNYRYSVCNEMFGSLPLEKAFELLASEGFQGVEIAPFTVFGNFRASDIERGIRTLRTALTQSGLTFVGFPLALLEARRAQNSSPRTPGSGKKAWGTPEDPYRSGKRVGRGGVGVGVSRAAIDGGYSQRNGKAILPGGFGGSCRGCSIGMDRSFCWKPCPLQPQTW
jgi:hypothetical protein